MAWYCYMIAVFAIVFSGCFKKVHSVDPNVTDPQSVTDAVCNTAECISTAAAMMEKMNLSADPCQDFNEFACGRFLKEYVLPVGISEISPFTVLTNNITFLLHDLIVNTIDPARPEFVKNIQRMFNSCMNENQIDDLGLTAYLNDRAFVDNWPTLNPDWNPASFDLKDVIELYVRANVFQLYDVTVNYDLTNASKHIIELRQPFIGIGRKNLVLPRNHSHILAYERYLVETAVALNASREVAERDARDLLNLEIELAKIMVPPEEHSVAYQLNPVKLNQFYNMYPKLDIARTIRAVFSAVNISLPDDEMVINSSPTYIKDIESVLECFPKRTIQNMFASQHAVTRVNNLDRRTRLIYEDYSRSLFGTSGPKPRWQHCTDRTSMSFGYGLSKMFADRVSMETTKCKVNKMIDELTEQFGKMIEEVTWMSNSTKSAALLKLAAMDRKVGYPDADFEEADLERIYEKHIMSEDNYYNNRILCDELALLENLELLRKPVNKNLWGRPPYMVNAHANLNLNEIVILGGLMQAPFYSKTSQDYLNFGGIGYSIGHEITHLFDYIGSLFDEKGNLRNWWAAEDYVHFLNRTRCIIKQYSNFYVDEINMTLSGVKSQGESEGDTGGVKASFRAYKQHVSKYGQQPRLPDLNLSQDQLFFLSFAQLYCKKSTDADLIQQVTSGEHPPGKYRIIGTLQNSEDFARAYNCSQGSYMNPVKKCGMW